ncbi:MAG: response regulator [Bdellovibrionales bacterium]
MPKTEALASAKVLLVDDEEEIRWAISHFLTAKGFSVEVAANFNEGLKLAESHTFSLIISDFKMPGGNGLDLFRQVRSLNPNPPKFILISGDDNISAVDQQEIGIFRVFGKPFAIKELVEAVKEALLHTS